MRLFLGCTTLLVGLTLTRSLAADDKTPPASDGPPPQLRRAGEVVGKVVKASDKSIVFQLTQVELAKSGSSVRRPRLKLVENEYELDFAEKATIRFRDLPMGPNGKPRQYSADEIAKLREPVALPGYKASLDDLRAGTVVRLTLSKVTRRDEPLVTAATILHEAPPVKDKPPAKDKPPPKGKSAKG